MGGPDNKDYSIIWVYIGVPLFWESTIKWTDPEHLLQRLDHSRHGIYQETQQQRCIEKKAVIRKPAQMLQACLSLKGPRAQITGLSGPKYYSDDSSRALIPHHLRPWTLRVLKP